MAGVRCAVGGSGWPAALSLRRRLFLAGDCFGRVPSEAARAETAAAASGSPEPGSAARALGFQGVEVPAAAAERVVAAREGALLEVVAAA